MTVPFPDAEKALVDHLNTLTPDIAPNARVVTWVQDTKENNTLIEQGGVFIIVRRVAGQQINRVIDKPVMEITVIAATRAKSWDILRKLQSRLVGWYGDVHHKDGSVTTITRVDETRGPNQFPDLNPDARRVRANLILSIRRPRR